MSKTELSESESEYESESESEYESESDSDVEDEEWPYCEGCFWCEEKGEPEKRPGPLPEGHVITMLEVLSRWPYTKRTEVFGSYESAWNRIKKEFHVDGEIGEYWQKNRFYEDVAEYEKGGKAMPKPTLRWACAQFNPCNLEYNMYLATGAGPVFVWDAYNAVDHCVTYYLRLRLQKIN